MLLIGSKAWELNQGPSLGRAATDLDIICTQEEFYALLPKLNIAPLLIQSIKIKGEHAVVIIKDNSSAAPKRVILEASFTDVAGKLTESNKQLVDKLGHALQHQVPILGSVIVPPCGVLLALKLSHKYKESVHFHKTRNDILIMKKFKYLPSIVGTLWLLQWQTARIQATAKKAPVLKQDKSTFFNENVPYVYDHDTIHASVKHLDKPAYCYYMQDDEEVLSSREKFFAQSEIVRLYGVLEESYVLALERAVIPYGTDPKKAFDTALVKVCTTITSGFFREYAWENYDKIQALYHESYIIKFQHALKTGCIGNYHRP